MARQHSAEPIPVNLVTGFLGVGKTTAIRHLLATHPAGQRWAVLVNEFGEVGVDGALLADQDVVVQEVAGGCMCCVAAPAFTTGLNRLIRQQRPDRILIEPSGLGHPAQVLETLTGPLYRSVLDVRATVCLMDARHLASARHREHPNFVDQIHLADVLVANKSDRYTDSDRDALVTFVRTLRPPKQRLGICTQGMLDSAWLELSRDGARRAAFPEAHAFLVDSDQDGDDTVHTDDDWLLLEGFGDGYHRAGWIMRPRTRWPLSALRDWIASLDVERCKGLFDTDAGWYTLNQDAWSPGVAPADGRSRLELIDAHRLPSSDIDERLRALIG